MFKLSYEDIIQKIIDEKGVSKEEIESKVNEKLKQLNDLVSKEGAAHIIANEFGVKIFDLEKKDFKIKDLFIGARNIDLVGKILRKYEVREFKTERGEGKVVRFMIGDETGGIMIVVWDTKVIDSLDNFNEEQVVKVSNGYVRDNNGFKEVHLGKDSGIEISNEDVKVGEFKPQRQRKKINELNEGDFSEIAGTVVQVFEPRFYNACPECNKKIDGKCETHGDVVSVEVPIVNFFLDDGSDSIRVVTFRENAGKVLGVENIKESNFNEVRAEVLGKQLVVNGKVVKNEMMDRKEIIANDISELKAVEVANELIGGL